MLTLSCALQVSRSKGVAARACYISVNVSEEKQLPWEFLWTWNMKIGTHVYVDRTNDKVGATNDLLKQEVGHFVLNAHFGRISTLNNQLLTTPSYTDQLLKT